MAEPLLDDGSSVQPVSEPCPRTCYRVERGEDVWFIQFDGDGYGPYNSEREALLFAIDAANKLFENGKDTEVMISDEAGNWRVAWVSGQDPYPPRL